MPALDWPNGNKMAFFGHLICFWVLCTAGIFGDVIPPTSTCQINDLQLECIGAQYPSNLPIAPNLLNKTLEVRWEGNGELETMCSETRESKVNSGHLVMIKRETDSLVPSLDGLQSREFIPSVVLISHQDFRKFVPPMMVRDSFSFAISWNRWLAQDATSMYYDGIRLKKAGLYAEAANMHLKAAKESNFEFKSAGYEYVNNLLRDGASSEELVEAAKRVQLLPLSEDLKVAFSEMALRAQRRITHHEKPYLHRAVDFVSAVYNDPNKLLVALRAIFVPTQSPNVVVICVATEETRELEALRISVHRCGYELVVLGLGAEYGSSGGTKLGLMEQWLLTPGGFDELGLSDDTILLFVDAYDVLLLPPASSGAIAERFHAFNASLIISGETGCWPDPGIAPSYPWALYDQQPQFGDLYDKKERTLSADAVQVPFPYPNSGGYIGRAAYMKRMIREVMDDVRRGHVVGGGTIGDADDQRWLQRHWVRYPREVAIDVMAEIFLSLHRAELRIALGDTPHSLMRPLQVSEKGVPSAAEISVIPSGEQGAATVWIWSPQSKVVQKPMVIHGNGHGKRLFRVISCQLGLYCKWAHENSSGPEAEL